MTDKNSMTIEELATSVEKSFEAVKIQLEAHIDRRFEELKDRTFDPIEKEEVVAAAKAYNQQLEDTALGTKDITLTRSEYDATSLVQGFTNRFTAPAEALVD